MENEQEKSHIKYFLIKLIIYGILAICVFIFRETLVEHLKYFIGGLMLLYGIEEIVFELIFKDHHFWHKDKIYIGLIDIILGSVLLIFPIDLESTCVIWATWSIARESFEIKELITEVKCIFLSILSGIESIAVIVLSITLILEPGEHHAMIHMYLLLAELVLTPLIPLLDEIILEKKNKKEEGK